MENEIALRLKRFRYPREVIVIVFEISNENCKCHESSFAHFKDRKTNNTKLVFILLKQQQCKEPS